MFADPFADDGGRPAPAAGRPRRRADDPSCASSAAGSGRGRRPAAYASRRSRPRRATEVARYASLLLHGTYAAAYLGVGLVKSLDGPERGSGAPTRDGLLARSRAAPHLVWPRGLSRWIAPVSAGLFALLDDVAVLARVAAASVDDIGAAAGVPVPRPPAWSSTTRRSRRSTSTASPPTVRSRSSRHRVGVAAQQAPADPSRGAAAEPVPSWLLTPLLMLAASTCATRAPRRSGADGAGTTSTGSSATEGWRATGADGDRRRGHPHRLHPVRRDHGDRAERGRRPDVRAPRGQSWSWSPS